MNNRSTTTTVVVIIVGLILLFCCCTIIATGLFGYFAYQLSSSTEFAGFRTEIAQFPTFDPSTSTLTPKPVIVRTPLPTPAPGDAQTYEILESEEIPQSDLRALAMRLNSIQDIPETVGNTSANHQIGDAVEFNASNTDTDENFKLTAKLAYATDNVYFFVEDGVSTNANAVKRLVDEFQDKIYPTDRAFFGSEWNPGIDGDPHLYILYARGLGFSVAGYYSSADEYSRLAHEYSNEKEMFYINADAVDIDDDYILGTLAHEFQHMIHWHFDRNEETWMNEGSSVMAELLNGYDTGGFDYSFINDPDLQLNAWGEDSSGNGPHYGAAFLFMTYFLGRFGEDATQALVSNPANGFRAVEDTLTTLQLNHPTTGQPLTALDIFGDWVIANYLGDASLSGGRYYYARYPTAPTISSETDTIYSCPSDTHAYTVHQFAADYYKINCTGQVTIDFTGSQQVQVIPATPNSGRYAVWSHRNDESDTTFTRAFDLSGVSNATLEYSAWWAIEENYDYVYLEASTDNGQTWTLLRPPACSAEDTTGNNFGCGYSGNSGGGSQSEWVKESVDLSQYDGQKILIRFEYVTDAAVNRPGFMLDDIAVPQLNYLEDFEQGDGGWDGAGFVRMDNLLPQEFLVQVIHKQGARTLSVERFPISADNTGAMTFNVQGNESLILVVSGVTRFTTEVASYEFTVK